MLSRENPTAREFDEYYAKEDPWGIANTPAHLARIQKLNQEFATCSFSRGFDIGCGEGALTGQLTFVAKFDAIDFSEVALERARKTYPKINFFKADLTDLRAIENHRYDFISCFETIYYITDDAERSRVLADIKSKGADNCVFCFSVVTIGENIHRKYFSYDEALRFFGQQFNIVNKFPVTLIEGRDPLPRRAVRRFRRLFLKERVVPDYLESLRNTAPEDAYQCVFIMVKK
jgi:Methyltransferase domain